MNLFKFNVKNKGKQCGWRDLISLSHEFYRVVKGRRSIRKYSRRKVPEETLIRVLDAARWAPSAHNSQPWRFIVITDEKLKLKLAREMANAWFKDLLKDGYPIEEIRVLTEGSVKRFTDPPVLIVACLTMESMDRYRDKRRSKAEYLMAVQSVSAAIQNILLAAYSEGLGTCWFCAPLFTPETVREVLGIPEEADPQALITLGYPAEEPIPPERLKLEETVFFNGWRLKR